MDFCFVLQTGIPALGGDSLILASLALCA